MDGTVYILLVNWNGWRDTIECLESVFRLDYPEFRVIVCDNDSNDDSLQKILDWAEGRLQVSVPESHPLHKLSSPPVAKPVSLAVYGRGEAETGGDKNGSARLILISTGANLGFAGGNNVGLRYALARGDFAFVWLLNNDTVVKPDSLTHLVQRMADRPEAGICGSLIPYYDAPDTIWAAGGGTLNRWLAKSYSLDYRLPVIQATAQEKNEQRMDYVAGASMLVSKGFLEDVGLMSEDYFLYFEEPDWYLRGVPSYSLAYAEKSIVYHKVGISTSRCDEGTSKSAREYYFRAQLLFTAKFFPGALPLVMLRVAINRFKSALRRIQQKLKQRQ